MSQVGRPPTARVGTALSVNSRFVVAGVGAHSRILPSRASSADLWASVEALAVAPHGVARLVGIHGQSLPAPAQRRFASYVAQARQYYQATRTVDPVSKPLLGYHFALNLTKAFLTARDPGQTFQWHGASDKTSVGQRYSFTQERVGTQRRGIAQELATRTGMGFWYASATSIKVASLVSYLPEAYDLYADALNQAPKLLPVSREGLSILMPSGTGH